jgi:hypothetical protein
VVFRVLVVCATILAVSGVAVCALTHGLSLVGVVPRFWVRAFAVALLAVFPMGGLATFLAIRVRRTYGLSHSRLGTFMARRAPRWLRRVGTGILFYAAIHFVVFCFVGSPESTSATHIPLMVSAVVAWFYVMFVQVFTVGLRDPKIITAAAASRPPGR